MRWHLQKTLCMMDIQILAITGASPSTTPLSANKSSFVSFLEKLVEYILTCNARHVFLIRIMAILFFFFNEVPVLQLWEVWPAPPVHLSFMLHRLDEWVSGDETDVLLNSRASIFSSTCRYENRGKSYFTFISYNFVLYRKNLGARRIW